ncbi:amidohydrolase family protein [Pseudonocardia endophytica]|uniref:Putative TIM-barrel fold metal-dependent hydrolase n=1 Tax=Pseudonocardia endophytica TaxID=401976 RepID=A0A4R1HSW0_PSEEN|nr:amidohydrolase family protein [Pseudonocardia endophytica]TCK25737.1 putative TIM-barrel fold metal-dependent hydrolase [Pseudonocardia endophytica]
MTLIEERPVHGVRPIQSIGTGIVDVDIHPVPPAGAVAEYVPQRWRRVIDEFGARTTNGLQNLGEYPQLYGGAMRADSWPDDGFPGSDLGMIRSQLLDRYDIRLGVLQCLSPGGQALNPAAQALRPEIADVLTRAVNDWQLDHLVVPEPRLRAAISLPWENPDLAVAELERIGSHPGVLAVLGLSKTRDPLGSRRYWPIYEAMLDYGLPLQVHLSQGGGNPATGTGWPSYHTEYHVGQVQSFQSQLLNLILSGTFDRFPDLRVMFVEGNVAHFVPLAERLDYHWETQRDEVPDLQRKPSEYLHDHVWVSTQPIDEPDDPAHLVEYIEEFGRDRVLFASDYPHFDFDDPHEIFPSSFPAGLKDRILRDNARRFFGLEDEA